jgi:hypothetical protein
VDLPMSARGHVEGRRVSTPDAKILDTELAAEDRATRAKMARALRPPFGRSDPIPQRWKKECRRKAARGPESMMREIFVARIRPKTLAMIGQANAILNEYARQGFVLTLRQLFYQFVSRFLSPRMISFAPDEGTQKVESGDSGLRIPVRLRFPA